MLERLLGFDVKLRQYEQGKQFADARGGARRGIEGLNRVWLAPEALPAPPSWTTRPPGSAAPSGSPAQRSARSSARS